MQARIEKAAAMKCDAIEPDNMSVRTCCVQIIVYTNYTQLNIMPVRSVVKIIA